MNPEICPLMIDRVYNPSRTVVKTTDGYVFIAIIRLSFVLRRTNYFYKRARRIRSSVIARDIGVIKIPNYALNFIVRTYENE